MNDVGYYFYGENAVDKDQFKTEILVKTEQLIKIQLWMHVCKQAHEFTTDITRCIHYAKKRNEDNWSHCFLMDAMQFVNFLIEVGVDCTWYKGIPLAYK